MSKIKWLVSLLCLYSGVSVAQEKLDDKGKIKFSSINAVGLINGSSNEAAHLQSINGFTKDKWFAGIGAGIDYYFYRSIPLFVDVRRDFSSKKNTPFIYADGGINVPWLKNEQKNSRGETDYSKGMYYDVGLGWKLKGKSNRAFIFSAGYNYKQVKEEVTFRWWGILPMTPAAPEKYDNRLNRIVIKVGMQL